MYSSKNMFKKLSLLLVVLMIATLLMPVINAYAAGVSGGPANSAVQFLYNDYTKNGTNNSDSGVGSYALYVLRQAGVDVTSWVYNNVNLEDAVVNTVNSDISNTSVSAKCLAQDLAAMEALGRNNLAGQLVQILQNRQSSSGFDAGTYSIFSNMPAYDLIGRVDLMSVINAVYAKDYILGTQDTTVSNATYGAWGYTYGGSYYADFVTTAEAVRALNYLDPGQSDAQVQTAINNGLNWMKNQQQADGSFVAGWDDPVVDTSEVIVTLKALGRDPADWKSSGDKSAVDYMDNNALNADGSFGTSKNDMDATWALCAYNLLATQFYLNPSSATLNTGDTQQFTSVWQNAYGATDVTAYADWSAADSSIASVNNSGDKGLATALKAGQTVVNAVYGGLTASAALTVGSSAGGSNGTAETVGMAVVGMNGELLYGPSYVTVSGTDKWGATVLGALDASGISYHTSSWSYGILVDQIEGQANSGTSGWMYAVNGQIPSSSPDKCNISNNDEIVWYYSNGMSQQPPNWDDLVTQASSGNTVTQPANLPAPVSDAALAAAIQSAGSTGLVALQAGNTQTTLALSSDQITEILGTGKPLAVTIQGVRFALSEDSLKVPELTAANTAQLQIAARILSSGDAQSLMESFAGKFELAGDVYQLDMLAVNKDGTQQNIEQFPDCKVLLTVPGAFREAAAAGKVAAYWYNDSSNTWVEVGGTYDATSGTISFQAPHFSKYALLETVSPPAGGTFKDIAGHWAQKEIEFMATKGYVAGVGDNQFAPDAPITRAEFTTILARMAGLTPNPGGALRFSDVPAGAWYRGTVGAAAGAGLVCGTGEHSFAPNEPVTREQMAVMIVRLMAKNGLDTTIGNAAAVKLLAGFGDAASVSPWAYPAVALVVQEGLMTGRATGQFVPLGNATRAEATVALYRVLQKLPQLGQ